MSASPSQLPLLAPAVWTAVPDPPPIAPGDVHLWRVELDVDRSRVEVLEAVLSTDERERAGRMLVNGHRFVVARGLLRQTLGRYLGLPPRGLSFAYGPRGKPSLVPELGRSRLEFSVSHTGSVALMAFAVERDLGVDVERVRQGDDWHGAAEVVLSDEERASIGREPPERRAIAFVRLWARREAYVKLEGGDVYSASIVSDPSVRLLEFEPLPRHVAAIAARGAAWHPLFLERQGAFATRRLRDAQSPPPGPA